MLGDLHNKYLVLSKSGVDWKTYDAPLGRCFGVPIKSPEHKIILDKEALFHTAQDLGYE